MTIFEQPTAQSRRPVALAFALAFAALAAPHASYAKGPAKSSAPIVLAAPRDLAAAIASIEKATGAKAADLELKGNPLPAEEGRSFKIEGPVATRLIEGSHGPFLKAGLYLFRLERSFGMGGGQDVVAVIKGTDRDALIRRVGTIDPTGKQTTDQIIAWLDALSAEEPFALNEIGEDYLAGRFAATPKDPAALAARCAQISPELIKGSGSAIDLLTNEIRSNRTLYLIW